MRSWPPSCEVMRLIYAGIIIKILYTIRSTPPYFFLIVLMSGLNVKMFSTKFALEPEYRVRKKGWGLRLPNIIKYIYTRCYTKVLRLGYTTRECFCTKFYANPLSTSNENKIWTYTHFRPTPCTQKRVTRCRVCPPRLASNIQRVNHNPYMDIKHILAFVISGGLESPDRIENDAHAACCIERFART